MKNFIQKLVDRFKRKPEPPKPVITMPVRPSVNPRQSIGRAIRATATPRPTPPQVYEWNGPGYTVVEDPVMTSMFARHYDADRAAEREEIARAADTVIDITRMVVEDADETRKNTTWACDSFEATCAPDSWSDTSSCDTSSNSGD